MTNEVIWTKLVLERFIQLANLTEEGVSGMIRNYCTKPVSTLTIVVSGMAATGTNLAVDITKQ